MDFFRTRIARITRKRRGCEPFSLSHAAIVSPEGRSSEVAGRRKARRDNHTRIDHWCHTDFTDDTDFSNTAMDYFLQLQGVTILNNTRISMRNTRISLKVSRISLKVSRISLKVSRISMKNTRISMKDSRILIENSRISLKVSHLARACAHWEFWKILPHLPHRRTELVYCVLRVVDMWQ